MEPGISTDMPAGEPVELVDGQWQPGVWNELQQLTCVQCKWDTLDGIEAARAHKAACPRCGPGGSPPASPSGILIADRWGNPVNTNTEGK
jgi:hypothetical protein